MMQTLSNQDILFLFHSGEMSLDEMVKRGMIDQKKKLEIIDYESNVRKDELSEGMADSDV